MKRYRFQGQTSLIAWAFLPVVIFAIAISSVKWYTENIGPTASEYPYGEEVDWGKVISNSPDVTFEITDSIKYYRYTERELFKRSNIHVANVSKLFPDFNATILLLEKQYPMLAFDQDGTSQMFEIRQNNGAIYYGRIKSKEGQNFYLNIAHDSLTSTKSHIVPLGKFTGKINMPKRQGIDVARTTMNVIPVITLVLALMGIVFLLTTPNPKEKPEFLFWAVYLSAIIPAACVVGWLFNWWHIFDSSYNFPEWIAIFWALSEIGLLGGIVFKNLPNPKKPIEQLQNSKNG